MSAGFRTSPRSSVPSSWMSSKSRAGVPGMNWSSRSSPFDASGARLGACARSRPRPSPYPLFHLGEGIEAKLRGPRRLHDQPELRVRLGVNTEGIAPAEVLHPRLDDRVLVAA